MGAGVWLFASLIIPLFHLASNGFSFVLAIKGLIAFVANL
jgi:hypothetical protein